MLRAWIPLVVLAFAVGGSVDDPFLAAIDKPGRHGTEPGGVDLDARLRATGQWDPAMSRRSLVRASARVRRVYWHIALVDFKSGPPLPDPKPVEGRPLVDALALRVPADAGVVLLPDLATGEALLEDLGRRLPRLLPGWFDASEPMARDGLACTLDRLLLPPIWRANPGARKGLRSAAVLIDDPDVRWGGGVALVAEVSDASLVLAQRRASLRWMQGRKERLRLDGLDATSDDGAVRSFFALDRGLAVWSTSRRLRDRVLAVGRGEQESLVSGARVELDAARQVFPRAPGRAVWVAARPFLERIRAAAFRERRLGMIDCEAWRLLVGADLLAARAREEWSADECQGNEFTVRSDGSVSCPIHGSARHPVPIGDMFDAPSDPPTRGSSACTWHYLVPSRNAEDLVDQGGVPAAASWEVGSDSLELLLPAASGAAALLDAIAGGNRPADSRREQERLAARRAAVAAHLDAPAAELEERVTAFLTALTGLVPNDPVAPVELVVPGERPEGPVVISIPLDGGTITWRKP